MVYPDLVSNFHFLNSFDTANAIAEDSYDKLKSLGYSVKLEQNLTGAGGPGILPNVLEIVQQIWEQRSLITLPVALIKFFYTYIKQGGAKLPPQSKRIAKVNINLKAYSKTLRVNNGVFTEKEQILNSLLECAVILSTTLRERYPHISFNFELEIELAEHKARLIYMLTSAELGYRRLPALFKYVAMREKTMSRLYVTKKFFFKREDWKVDDRSSDITWSYSTEIKKFYYLVVGRLVLRDYQPVINHVDR